MRAKIITLIILCFCLSQAFAQEAGQDITAAGLEPIKPGERILVLAPHPDDETIGCAGVIQQALDAGAEVKVAYLTCGEHNEVAFIVYKKEPVLLSGEFIQMGQVRRKEATEAMRLLGVGQENLVFLGYPDFGTFAIFSRYWQASKPFRDILTRISRVPYKDSLSFGTPYNAENILRDLKRVIRDYRPSKIFVSHPADVNVDHKALYLYLEIALAELKGQIAPPKVYPYLIHRLGWPLPRHYHPELPLSPPKEFSDGGIRWQSLELTPEQLEEKHQAILCYRSQTASSAFYLLAFARRNELFGAYPEITLEALAKESPVSDWLYMRDRLLGLFNLSKQGAGQAEEARATSMSAEAGSINYGLERDYLLIRIKKSEQAKQRVAVLLYLFGYSYDRPFAQMPKIQITSKHRNFKVFDAGRQIKADGVSLELTADEVRFKIPLGLLGDPDFILTSARAYTGSLPILQPGFRKINIIRRKQDGI